jgi:hypothetical protein
VTSLGILDTAYSGYVGHHDEDPERGAGPPRPVAAKDYSGTTLSDALARLLAEHEQARTRREISAA